MKKHAWALLLMFVTLNCHAQDKQIADANAESRSVSGKFESIHISGGIDLYLSQSDKHGIAVSASEKKFRDAVKTVVENNSLRIYFEGNNRTLSLRNKKLTVYVSFPALSELNISGACDVYVLGLLKSDVFKIDLSGASDFEGELSVEELRLNMSGSSDAKISGRSRRTYIESTGASDVQGWKLTTDYCTARATGASDIEITVNKELRAFASGASKITYAGSPEIKEISNTGASSISRKNAKR